MSKDNIISKFPADFPVHLLPEEAKEESIEVYRICRSGAVDEDSFLPTYLDEISKTKENDGCEHDIGYYSMSVYEKKRDARQKLKFFRGKQPNAIAAKGTTDPSCGIIQKTRERKKSKNKDSHIDWWLYENAKPHKYFKEVEINTDKKEG